MFNIKEEQITTDDGVKIVFNHCNNGLESVLIFLPGWFMTKDSKSFRQMGEAFSHKTDVICMDFRGHGKSSGFYTFTAKEIKDIKPVIDYAAKQYKKIYLIGFSLGASLSLMYGASDERINKIIAVSPAADFGKIENHFWKVEAWLPTLQKLELKRWFSIRPTLPFHKKVKPIDIIENVKCPTLFLAGEKDPTVYPWHTEKLYKKAICKKKYKLFKNCNHAEDLFIQEKSKFIAMCCSWLFDEK